MEYTTDEKYYEIIREVNGILGAVDGDTVKASKRLVRAYNITSWEVDRLRDIIRFLLDRVGNEDKQYIEKEMQEISNKVKEALKP